MKSGYLYVLVHPSDPTLVKIGVTVCKPEERLAEHNCNLAEYAGNIVKETGQKWILKEYFSVEDPYWAETAFWETFSPGPFKDKGIEVMRVRDLKILQPALEAAKKAGIRPLPKPRTTPVRNREWMIKQLEGTGITMTGNYRGLVTKIEFQCSKGHVFKKGAGKVAYNPSCPHC